MCGSADAAVNVLKNSIRGQRAREAAKVFL
jgi:hypothetical protein